MRNLEQSIKDFVLDSQDILSAVTGSAAGKYSPNDFIIKSITDTRTNYNLNTWHKEQFTNICTTHNLSELDLKHKLLQYQLTSGILKE